MNDTAFHCLKIVTYPPHSLKPGNNNNMTSHSLSHAKSSSLSAAFFPGNSTVLAHKSVNFVGYNCLPRRLKCSARQLRDFGAVCASVRWLLQPIGDGDSSHIGYKIAMPGSFEIASDVVTVGRVPEKADIVISVPTVSALHAQIQKTEKNLLITDLDSTNGTFIDERRLQPGVVATASPGNLIAFGDINLAIFKVYKVDEEDITAVAQKPQTELDQESTTTV